VSVTDKGELTGNGKMAWQGARVSGQWLDDVRSPPINADPRPPLVETRDSGKNLTSRKGTENESMIIAIYWKGPCKAKQEQRPNRKM
jgi:hypothetical protein